MGAPREPKGYLALILHAHLPFVRHPENRYHLEELWLFEAITDTYLPLIEMMQAWVRDGVRFRMAMSVTPTLASMLGDPFLKKRYVEHLDRMAALARREMERHRGEPRLFDLARMYRDRFEWARRSFLETHGADILASLKGLQDHGLEIMASAATHGYLPLLEPHRAAVRAQILAGIEHHRTVFGRDPKGFWLPECAYFPGHDEILAAEGIRYTVVETHGVLHAVPRPKYGPYAPVLSPGGVACFPRDVETSKQVWSAHEGYPGDYDYREFYRDVGHDLPWEEIAPFMPWGVRADTGLKYYRVTGKTEQKELYDPERAVRKAKVHAAHFLYNRQLQISRAAGCMDRKPLVVAPYDAELFGHWWFEGPTFLDEVVRGAAAAPDWSLATPSDYLDEYPVLQRVEVSESSWGYKGYHEVWLDGANNWIYRHLHEGARRMEELAGRTAGHAAGLVQRALDQAARELLLAQSSDWAFIMKSGTAVEYAARRARGHLVNFLRLADEIERDAIDAARLAELEDRTRPLEWIRAGAFRSGRPAPAGVLA